ncbi:hypothetical protein VSDG_00108 [Cytospora chrysosperma]|uniref:Uncharacterized protein n=1 Tax=Cytospora chrysosperma TaxID=252740 RepID=A0A423WQF2_CYTCH|nr:hypothetical protein VSDG_00108 [Valsa sordida]
MPTTPKMADHSDDRLAFWDTAVQDSDPSEMELANELLTRLFQNRSPQERDDYSRRFFGRQTFAQLQQDLTAGSHPDTLSGQHQVGKPVGHCHGDPLSLAIMLNKICLSGRQESPEKRSPLDLLRVMVESFFRLGPETASLLFSSLHYAVGTQSYKMVFSSMVRIDVFASNPSFIIDNFPWNSCKMAASLVLLLAAHATPESLREALKPQSQSMGGMPTRESLKTSVPDSLSREFRRAKRAALEEGKTTVMGVKMIDKHIFDLVAQGTSEQYFSFAHTFTMGLGPEGVVIWQAFGKHGYRLDEYIRDGHARVRSWDEAKQFVDDFEKLVNGKGFWSAKTNKLYKKLFLVDINSLCSGKGPERPVTPRFRAHVQVHCINDVKCEDVSKFLWASTSN